MKKGLIPTTKRMQGEAERRLRGFGILSDLANISQSLRNTARKPPIIGNSGL
jgi:hypothetical protein